MQIKIIKECGFDEAMLGLSLSYSTKKDMFPVALKLCNKDGGHNKFLESMIVWLDINAARYWWSQFDTYRTGTSKQSESTMHTLMKRELNESDFELHIPSHILNELNYCIKNKEFNCLKNILPEGFLQRRIVCTTYKTIRNIIIQRRNHKLSEWKYFCKEMKNLTHFNLLGVTND